MAHKSLTESIADVGKDAGSAVAETYRDSGAAARKTANNLNALANAVAHDTRDGVRQVTDLVENESSKVIGYVRSSVQERPNLTLGIAAGVGILIGMMLSSRR